MAPERANEGHRKRLKERFSASALKGFHDYEAVELLLTYAIPRRDVKPLAKDLVRRFGGFKGVFDADPAELAGVRGIGENASALIKLAGTVARAYLREQSGDKSVIKCPEDAVALLEGYSGRPEAEMFFALYLNTKNEVLGVELLHEGRLESTSLSPREVIEKAFKHNARSVIFVHRTPDEFAFPAGFDRGLLAALDSAASAVDIIVHDQILLARESHLSARESGVLARDT